MDAHNTKRLRRLAESATPGPWRTIGGQLVVVSKNSAPHAAFVCVVDGVSARKENARFIAASSPDVVLGLLDAAERAARMNVCTCCRPGCDCGNYSDPCPLCELRSTLGIPKIEEGSLCLQMVKLRCERDEARAVLERVERECGKLMKETRDDDSEHGLATQVDSLTKERDACRAALDKHDAALRNRRHGGVAAGHCVYEVRKALEAPDFVDNLGPVGDLLPDGEG